MKSYFITSRTDGRIPKTISNIVAPKKRKKQNKECIKQALDYIKLLHKEEKDFVNKRHLAEAGLALNNILLR